MGSPEAEELTVVGASFFLACFKLSSDVISLGLPFSNDLGRDQSSLISWILPQPVRTHCIQEICQPTVDGSFSGVRREGQMCPCEVWKFFREFFRGFLREIRCGRRGQSEGKVDSVSA